MVKVIVDTAKCVGHARCAAVAPDVFVLNADGYNDTPEKEVPEELREQAKRGARACPERIIRIEE